MIVDVVSSFSFLTHFNSILKGVIDIRDILFFATLIAFWLYANVLRDRSEQEQLRTDRERHRRRQRENPRR